MFALFGGAGGGGGETMHFWSRHGTSGDAFVFGNPDLGQSPVVGTLGRVDEA